MPATDDLQTVQLPAAVMKAPPRYGILREEDGRTILQPPPPATGLIWISVITVGPKPGHTGEVPDMHQIVQQQALQRGRPVQELPDGKLITSFDEQSEQDGQPLFVRTCEVGIEQTLGVFTVVIPRADVSDPANAALLADLPAMIESFQPLQRTEFVETPTGTIETKVTAVAQPSPTQRRPFTADEQRQFEECLQVANGLLGRYAGTSHEATPTTLDVVFIRWLEDRDPEKPDGETVALAIGALFGEFLRHKLAMRWTVLSDDQGEAWALEHDHSSMLVFPIESVRKRVESGETNFLHNLYRITESHLHSDRYPKT